MKTASKAQKIPFVVFLFDPNTVEKNMKRHMYVNEKYTTHPVAV